MFPVDCQWLLNNEDTIVWIINHLATGDVYRRDMKMTSQIRLQIFHVYRIICIIIYVMMYEIGSNLRLYPSLLIVSKGLNRVYKVVVIVLYAISHQDQETIEQESLLQNNSYRITKGKFLYRNVLSTSIIVFVYKFTLYTHYSNTTEVIHTIEVI